MKDFKKQLIGIIKMKYKLNYYDKNNKLKYHFSNYCGQDNKYPFFGFISSSYPIIISLKMARILMKRINSGKQYLYNNDEKIKIEEYIC